VRNFEFSNPNRFWKYLVFRSLHRIISKQEILQRREVCSRYVNIIKILQVSSILPWGRSTEIPFVGFGSFIKNLITKLFQTCNSRNIDCIGHFGHIQFPKPVFNFGFMQDIMDTLRCVCPHCGNLRLNKLDRTYAKIAGIREFQ
jgi:hypothetical protein